MVLASLIAVIDGVAGPNVVLIGLLAIPPLVAAIRSSLPETAVVGGVCVVLAVISGLWNMNVDSTAYFVEVLTVISGTIAGLWLASLRVDLDREKDAAELMADAGALIEDRLSRRERAQHLAELAVPSLGDVAMVDLLEEDGSIVRAAAHSRGSKVAEVFSRLRADDPIRPDGPHPVAEAIRTGETISLGQLTDEQIDEITVNEEERKLVRRHRFRACLILPLVARNKVQGTLTLWITRPSNAFDPTARRTAGRLAERAAIGIDNARVHEQQAHIAAVLQRSLLPRSLPEVTGFEVASRFLAAGEAYEVGGDFYDGFRTGSSSWNFVIGDVCGKGPEAAALTSLARYTIRTASGPSTLPSSILRVLHDSIDAERTDLRYCTAALLRVEEPANGAGDARLTVSLGGHPPPLVLRSDGEVEPIGSPGSLLGVLPDPDLKDASAVLRPGDSLVLYTDGMLDARDRRRGDDTAWLEAQVGKAAGADPEKVADRLTKAAVRRHGGEPRDDIAVIVLRRAARG